MQGSVYPSLGRNEVIVGKGIQMERSCLWKLYSKLQLLFLEIGLVVTVMYILTAAVVDLECKNQFFYNS